MKLTVPCLYMGYGRYIARFRAIPYEKDCLNLAERRLLLSFYDLAKSPNKKLFKSLKVVGHTVGNYHPHGDISTYGVLAQLVENGVVHGEGNWGTEGIFGRENPAAMRYTECQLKSWVYDLAFKYIKYVPEENIEFEIEKLYLPSPIPLGLIGKNIITGISFHRTIIPRYKYQDLKNRLNWILCNYQTYINNKDNKDNWNETTVGPVIIPNIDNCDQYGDPNDFYNILINGKQSIITCPKIEVDEKKRTIYVTSLVPNSRQNNYLLTLCKPNEKTKEPPKFDYEVLDISKKTYRIKVTFSKKADFKKSVNELFHKYLKTNISYDVMVHDDSGNVNKKGIDELLINSYINWVNLSLQLEIDKFNKIYETFVHNYIKQSISYILSVNGNRILSVDEIIKKFEELVNNNTITNKTTIEKFDINSKTFLSEEKIITKEDVEYVCKTYSIKKLLESSTDINDIINKIQEQKQTILDNDKIRYNEFIKLNI